MTAFHVPRVLRLAAVAGLLATALSAHADVVLSLTPSSATASAGSAHSVSLTATNLQAGSAIGGFAIDIAYDPALWSFGTVKFGSLLGDIGAFQALSEVDASTPGLLKLTELSLVGAFDPQPLSALQPGPGVAFTLATMTFDGLTAGDGAFRIVGMQLTDAAGLPLAVSAVPEPSSFALLAIGGLALLGWQRRRATSTPQRSV